MIVLPGGLESGKDWVELRFADKSSSTTGDFGLTKAGGLPAEFGVKIKSGDLFIFGAVGSDIQQLTVTSRQGAQVTVKPVAPNVAGTDMPVFFAHIPPATQVTAIEAKRTDGTVIALDPGPGGVDELIEDLVGKAEEGFDVEEIIRRRGGRPAMGAGAAEQPSDSRSSAAGDEGDDYVGGVTVEVLPSAVVDRRGARIAVTGGDLRVAKRDSRVEGGHDERCSQHVRVHPAEPGPLANRVHPAMCGSPLQSLAITAAKDRPLAALTDGDVDGPSRSGNERNECWLLGAEQEHPELGAIQAAGVGWGEAVEATDRRAADRSFDAASPRSSNELRYSSM